MTKREFVLRFVYKNLPVPSVNAISSGTIDKVINEGIAVFDRCEELLKEPEPVEEPPVHLKEHNITYKDGCWSIEVYFFLRGEDFEVNAIFIDGRQMTGKLETHTREYKLLSDKIREYLREM